MKAALPAPAPLALRDVREGGAWTPMQRAKNDLLFVAAMTGLAIGRRLPLPLLRRVGRVAGRLAHLLARTSRDRAVANLALAMPDRDPAERRDMARQAFETLGELLAETVAWLRPTDRPALLDVSADARRVIEDARGGGRGVIFASAPLGPWENVAASLVAAGVPLTVVTRGSYDPRFDRVLRDLRRATGVRAIVRSSPSVAFEIVRALRRGEVVGMPMDLRSRVPSVEAPFLGHPAPSPVGPARIALRTGAAVVVGTVASPETAAAPAETCAPITLRVTASRIRSTDLRAEGDGALELTSRINDELSRRIRALPGAWVWMHERWSPPSGYAQDR